LKKKGEIARDIIEEAKYVDSAFYYLFFLALEAGELKDDKKKLSVKWGQAGWFGNQQRISIRNIV
jgi:hypothetical protein